MQINGQDIVVAVVVLSTFQPKVGEWASVEGQSKSVRKRKKNEQVVKSSESNKLLTSMCTRYQATFVIFGWHVVVSNNFLSSSCRLFAATNLIQLSYVVTVITLCYIFITQELRWILLIFCVLNVAMLRNFQFTSFTTRRKKNGVEEEETSKTTTNHA